MTDGASHVPIILNPSQSVQQSPDDLAAWSPKDAPWDTHRAQADAVQGIYARAVEFEALASRMAICAGRLRFAWQADDDGVIGLKLRQAQFCRVRHCPVCQWRRSLMWLARFYSALPEIQQQYPKSRWVMLNLSVRNCQITELRSTIAEMNRGWQALIKRKEFRVVQGWIRTTEVTRNNKPGRWYGTAHPHFHCLLLVPSRYFSGREYLSFTRWQELWRSVLNLDYLPDIEVHAVTERRGGVSGAAPEVLKYTTKPADLIADDEWLLEYTRQVHKLRFIATGGVLKDALREHEESNDDLIHADETAAEKPADDGAALLAFDWQRKDKRYRRNPKADTPVRSTK